MSFINLLSGGFILLKYFHVCRWLTESQPAFKLWRWLEYGNLPNKKDGRVSVCKFRTRYTIISPPLFDSRKIPSPHISPFIRSALNATSFFTTTHCCWTLKQKGLPPIALPLLNYSIFSPNTSALLIWDPYIFQPVFPVSLPSFTFRVRSSVHQYFPVGILSQRSLIPNVWHMRCSHSIL